MIHSFNELDTITRKIIAEQLGWMPRDITDKSTMDSLGADSLDTIELTMALEEEFEIEIPDEEAEALYDKNCYEIIVALANKLKITVPTTIVSPVVAPQVVTKKGRSPMKKKSEKVFIVRGFNVATETFFKPTGVIEDKTTFTELVTKNQAEAVAAILADDNISTMTVPSLVSAGVYSAGLRPDQIAEASAPKNIVQVLDLTISLATTDKQAVRGVKSALREVLKRWAEKSRVKNKRGFRANAIKTPTFIYDTVAGAYVTEVKVQVLLSSAIVYSNHMVDIEPSSYATFTNDIALLRKELNKQVMYFSGLRFAHSLHGKGEVL